MPIGKIIGRIEPVDCIKTTPKFFDERIKENRESYTKSIFKEDYAWKVEVKEKFETPIEIKGKLGLWEYEE